jgi:hypothetical protein
VTLVVKSAKTTAFTSTYFDKSVSITKEIDMAHTDNFWIGIVTLAVVGSMLVNAALVALV